MTSGEPRPGTGPESLAQDPKAEAARLWQTAQVEFGAPADSSAAASPAGLPPPLPPDENRQTLIATNNEDRRRYVEIERAGLNERLAADARNKEGLGTARLSFAEHFGKIFDGVGYDPRLQIASRESYMEEKVKDSRGEVANDIFKARLLPDDLQSSRIPHLYSEEDYHGIEFELYNQLKSDIDFARVPFIFPGGVGVQTNKTRYLADIEWLDTWREYFKTHPEEARAADITVGEDKRWQERMDEKREEIIEELAAKAGGLQPEPGEPATEPEAQPDPVKEAREALESELTAIGEFFEGKKPEIGILEDWQAEKMRRQKEWIREDHLAEDVNKWLENRIAPLIFQARLRGDDQIAKDFVNLCSPDQFDTLILAVGQLIAEATEKE